MTITELVTRLLEIREEVGDVNVISPFGEMDDCYPVDNADVAQMDKYDMEIRYGGGIGVTQAVKLT